MSSSAGAVGSCLKPGRKGTRKLVREFGERLVCVRYRYDARTRTRTKTVELVVDVAPWTPSPARHVLVDVRWGEERLRAAMRRAGGWWDPEERLWKIRYDRAVELGLSRRIRIATPRPDASAKKPLSAETKKHPPAETRSHFLPKAPTS
jgi:hypothetical protein